MIKYTVKKELYSGGCLGCASLTHQTISLGLNEGESAATVGGCTVGLQPFVVGT